MNSKTNTRGRQRSTLKSNPRDDEGTLNPYYGLHIQGIPFNPTYQDGIMVRNPRGEDFPHQVLDKNGKQEQYSRWEKKHFSGDKGRPRLYTDEERLERKRESARKYYLNKKRSK